MSEPCRHERDAAILDELTAVRVHGALGAAYLEVDALRAELAGPCAHTALALIYREERDDALAALARVRALIGAGRWNPTSARADIKAALEAKP